MENEASFEYTYSAPDQEEIRRIREKYLPKTPNETKLEQLRRLDESVTRKGTVVSLAWGILSCLVMGTGMSFCMELTEYFAAGIVLGIVGMIGIGLSYPIYSFITRKERQRISPEILRLTEELLEP